MHGITRKSIAQCTKQMGNGVPFWGRSIVFRKFIHSFFPFALYSHRILYIQLIFLLIKWPIQFYVFCIRKLMNKYFLCKSGKRLRVPIDIVWPISILTISPFLFIRMQHDSFHIAFFLLSWWAILLFAVRFPNEQ